MQDFKVQAYHTLAPNMLTQTKSCCWDIA